METDSNIVNDLIGVFGEVIKKLIEDLKMEKSPLKKANISADLISKTIQLNPLKQ